MDTAIRDLVTEAIHQYADRPEAAAIAVLNELEQCSCTNLLGNGWCDEDPVMVTALCESLDRAITMIEQEKMTDEQIKTLDCC